MNTDKLFYRIFLLQPELIAELIPDLPTNCQFDYSAPVLKERERRLDGLLTPIGDMPQLPLIFLEAQMQSDEGFYRRFFAQVFLYIEQYKVTRPWRGLMILHRHNLKFGSEIPYDILFEHRVQRLYLEDLISQTPLSPNLALLRLLVLPPQQAPESARALLQEPANPDTFRHRLDLVESILVSKFPALSLAEIRKMLDIPDVQLQDTQFYKDVFQQGLEQGLEQGEIELLLRLLTRRFGQLSLDQQQQVRNLSEERRNALTESFLDFQNVADLQRWLQQ